MRHATVSYKTFVRGIMSESIINFVMAAATEFIIGRSVATCIVRYTHAHTCRLDVIKNAAIRSSELGLRWLARVVASEIDNFIIRRPVIFRA